MIVNLCRIIVAVTFIFSGFVKAIDPIGTQYKLQDYLGAIGMAGILPNWTLLAVAVFLAAIEFCIGIFLLFAIQRRLISKLTVAFMAFMTMVTVWIVVADPVKDCGCFGDALHLTNTETLIKNIVLLVCSLAIMYRPLAMFRFVSKSNQWIVTNYTIVFILVIAALVQFVEMFLKKNIPSLYESLGVYLPLITTNCAVLGVALNNVSYGYNLAESFVYGLGISVGFALALLLMAGIRENIIEGNDRIPHSFQGSPIVLITACLMAIAFFGFGGLI